MFNLTKLVAASLFFVASLAMAEGNKIAVVDMERALFQSDAAKTSFKQVEDQFGDDIQKIKLLEQEMVANQEKLQKDGAIMSDDEQRKIRNEIKEKQSEFQFFAGKLQEAEKQWRQQFFRASLPRLQEILKKLIDEEGINVVLNGQAVIHVDADLDLTKKLLNKLNEASTKK